MTTPEGFLGLERTKESVPSAESTLTAAEVFEAKLRLRSKSPGNRKLRRLDELSSAKPKDPL